MKFSITLAETTTKFFYTADSVTEKFNRTITKPKIKGFA